MFIFNTVTSSLIVMFKKMVHSRSSVVHTFFFYTVSIFVGLLFLFPCTLILLLPKKYRYTNKFYLFLVDLLYRVIVWALQVPITVQGAENIPHTPAVIVANHQSSLDIPVIGSLLKRHAHIWFALAYYAHLPVIGFFIRRTGIPVDRNNCGNAARALRTLIKTAQECPCHVIIFPEGARYVDGKIHDFFNGFAILAKKTQRPVVPIYMPYNRFACPPNQLLIYAHALKVIVGEPMYIQEQETELDFVQRVHAWFLLQEQL